jgi:hypothetical protein
VFADRTTRQKREKRIYRSRFRLRSFHQGPVGGCNLKKKQAPASLR